MKSLAFSVLCLFALPATAGTLSSYMHDGIPNASFVPRYSDAERQQVSGQKLGNTITLTPNSPYASDGTHFEVWKPSFVVGTADGGEIGVNFWNLHTDGHVNVSLAPGDTHPRLLDCRVVTSSAITYKIYIGDAPPIEGTAAQKDGHAWIAVPSARDTKALVELWPSPGDVPTGYLGCDISVIN